MTPPTQQLEQALWTQGLLHVAGLDEAGRGAWAGPIVAASAVMPPAPKLAHVADSKTIPEHTRETVFDQITATALDWAVGVVSAQEIDLHGIQWANAESMRRALLQLTLVPQHVLADGRFGFEFPHPTTWVVRGDAQSYVIACASIIAKVTRDRLMRELHESYPHYGFHEHKGYGTAQHQAALQAHGPLAEHRRSFSPICDMIPT